MELTKETSLFKKDAIKTDVIAAAATATNYIEDVSGSNQTGMTLQPASNSADNYMQLDATEIGIYQNGHKIASYGNIITLYRLVNGNPVKTLEITGTGLQLYGSSTINADVSLTSAGLVLGKGGIEAGIPGETGFIYLSTEDYPLKNSNITPPLSGLTINGFTPTAALTDGRENDDVPWRHIIGTKFGVNKEGKLYASDVDITGNINATTGSIAAEVRIGGRSQTEYLNSEIYKNAGFRYSKDIIIYGDSDKYYPVYFNNNQDEYNQNIPHEIMISRGYAEQAPNDWNTSTHKGALTLQIKWNYGGWGGATYKAEILAFNEMYSTMVGDVIAGTGSGMLSTIYLRGGGSTGALYHIYSDIQIDSTRYGSNFPLIGITEGSTIMGIDSYSWTVASPLTVPNTMHIKSLIAENVASNYITYINATDGIRIHNANDETNYARINSNGLQVYKTDTQVASFGNTAIIGKQNKNHIVLDDHTLQMQTTNEESSIFVHFSDFRGEDGTALIKTNLVFNFSVLHINIMNIGCSVDSTKDYIIKINGTQVGKDVAVLSGDTFQFFKYQNYGTDVDIDVYLEYYTKDSRAQAFTLGRRGSPVLGNAPGIWSLSAGYYNTASGMYSFAQGQSNVAQGNASCAFGTGTKATGRNSFACGNGTIAKSDGTTAFGYNTIATNEALVCGKYNDYSSRAAFQVGIGSSDARENGLSVNSFGIFTCGIYVVADKLPIYSGTTATWQSASWNGKSYLQLARSSSSKKYKENISLITQKELDPKLLYNLPVRQFRYKEGVLSKEDPYNLTRPLVIGFIAEEVDQYYPVASVKRQEQIEDWDVRYIVPAMLSLIQDQHEQIENLTARIEALENK